MFNKLIKHITPKVKDIYISLENQNYFDINIQRKVTKITIEDPGIVTIDNIWE